MKSTFLDDYIDPIDRVTFNKWERFKFKIMSFFGFKPFLTWRQVIIISARKK